MTKSDGRKALIEHWYNSIL